MADSIPDFYVKIKAHMSQNEQALDYLMSDASHLFEIRTKAQFHE